MNSRRATTRVMKYARAARRAAAFTTLTLGFYAVWLLCRPFVSFSTGASSWLRSFIFQNWARCTAYALAVRVSVAGEPPPPPFLLVSNHLSYLDIVVLGALLGGVFVAKREVARWPVLGAMCRGMGTIFIDRESRRDAVRVAALIERRLREGDGVVLFPEGTSTRGRAVLPFKSALLETAARTGLPVSCAAITYRTAPPDAPADSSVCWWGTMTFLDHFGRLMQLAEIGAVVSFGDHAISSSDRKVLTAALHREVTARFTPVISAEQECELTRQ